MEIASDGVGRFACSGQSVSVYVNEKATGRDLFARYVNLMKCRLIVLGYQGLRSPFDRVSCGLDTSAVGCTELVGVSFFLFWIDLYIPVSLNRNAR